MEKEVWIDIIGFEGYYQISSVGNIKSVDRCVNSRWGVSKKKSKILTLHLNIRGYLKAVLSKGNGRFNLNVHRAVALHFISNPLNKLEVNHINGIKTDNRVENLEWSTRSENVTHSIETGLRKDPPRKLNKKLVEDILKDIPSMSQPEICKKYKISRSSVYKVKYNLDWSAIQFHNKTK